MTSVTSLPAGLRHVAGDIKLAHTVFALPFAVLGAFLAAGWADRLVKGWEFVLILAAMFFARTMAMTVNRWADARFDAANPRTAGRAIPAGRVSRPFVLGVAVACAAALVATAAAFWIVGANPWPVLLSPIVIAVLASYSFAKRRTALAHAMLGLALGLSPVAAAVGIEPGFALTLVPWLLLLVVLGWVAGFDVIYALQDVAFDREAGLFSLPARLGEARAMVVSRSMHAASAGLLWAAWWVSPELGPLFAIAAGLTVVLLVVEHALVWSPARRRIAAAFFPVNGAISLLLGIAGVYDVVAAVR